MSACNKTFKYGARFYFLAQLLVFLLMVFAFVHAKELGIGKYLAGFGFMCTAIYFILFYKYMKHVSNTNKANINQRVKQPWERNKP